MSARRSYTWARRQIEGLPDRWDVICITQTGGEDGPIRITYLWTCPTAPQAEGLAALLQSTYTDGARAGAAAAGEFIDARAVLELAGQSEPKS